MDGNVPFKLYTYSPKGVTAHFADLPDTGANCAVGSDGTSLIYASKQTLVFSYNVGDGALYVNTLARTDTAEFNGPVIDCNNSGGAGILYDYSDTTYALLKIK